MINLINTLTKLSNSCLETFSFRDGNVLSPQSYMISLLNTLIKLNNF